MLQNFLDWVQSFPNVWIVNNQQVSPSRLMGLRLAAERTLLAQMLEWIKNPVPNSQIAQVKALQCHTPDVPADEKICNGIPQNEVRGLVALVTSPLLRMLSWLAPSAGGLAERMRLQGFPLADVRLTRTLR